MAKTLDFNTFTPPYLELVMKDEARTHIRVTLPPEKLIEELKDASEALESTVSGTASDETITTELYEYAARLISYNREKLSVSAVDLRDKFHLTMDELIGFFSVYVDFITEIINAKN